MGLFSKNLALNEYSSRELVAKKFKNDVHALVKYDLLGHLQEKFSQEVASHSFLNSLIWMRKVEAVTKEFFLESNYPEDQNEHYNEHYMDRSYKTLKALTDEGFIVVTFSDTYNITPGAKYGFLIKPLETLANFNLRKAGLNLEAKNALNNVNSVGLLFLGLMDSIHTSKDLKKNMRADEQLEKFYSRMAETMNINFSWPEVLAELTKSNQIVSMTINKRLIHIVNPDYKNPMEIKNFPTEAYIVLDKHRSTFTGTGIDKVLTIQLPLDPEVVAINKHLVELEETDIKLQIERADAKLRAAQIYKEATARIVKQAQEVLDNESTMGL